MEMTDIGSGILQQKKFSFHWKIEHFFANCKKIGDFYTSPFSKIDYFGKVIQWRLRAFPRGQDEKSLNHVPLYLHFKSDNVSEVLVDYRLSIVNENNGQLLSPFQRSSTFKGPVDDWGSSKFVQQNFIKDAKNGAMIDDTLRILCEITFHQIDQEVTENDKVYENLLNDIGKGFEDYEKLIESNDFSDVTFNIQGKKMHLHKNILSCRNIVFKSMFEYDMKEKNENTVDITDVDYEVMKELFRFIYAGKVNNIEKIANDLLLAADKYSVTELQALCEKTLYDQLVVDNAIEYLKLTEMCDTIHLKKLIIKFIVDNLKSVVQGSNFKLVFADLNGDVICEIMQAIAEKD